VVSALRLNYPGRKFIRQRLSFGLLLPHLTSRHRRDKHCQGPAARFLSARSLLVLMTMETVFRGTLNAIKFLYSAYRAIVMSLLGWIRHLNRWCWDNHPIWHMFMRVHMYLDLIPTYNAAHNYDEHALALRDLWDLSIVDSDGYPAYYTDFGQYIRVLLRHAIRNDNAPWHWGQLMVYILLNQF